MEFSCLCFLYRRKAQRRGAVQVISERQERVGLRAPGEASGPC